MQLLVLGNGLANSCHQVGGVVQKGAQVSHEVLHHVAHCLHFLTRDGLDAANAGSDAALTGDANHAELACCLGVAATAELNGVAELHHAHLVAILLTKQGNGTHLLGFIDGTVAEFLQWDVGANLLVDDVFHLAQLLGCDLLEVREVEAQSVSRDERAALLHMCAQHLAQGCVEQVGAGVVRLNGTTGFNVDTCHEFCLGVLRQLLHDVYALVVLTLGIDDVDGFVFADKYAAVTNLTTHLSIERGLVEHEFIERVLLLRHLAIAKDVAGVFSVVVAHELLLAIGNLHPVGALHLSGIARALLLLLHLSIELVDVHCQAVLTADEFRQVEGETVGVEQAEGRCTVEDGLLVSLQLVHGTVEQVDTTLQGAQERIFFFLHDATDELLLGLQFGEGVAHLLNEHGQQLIEECFALAEERIGIAHGTAQDAADDVAGLGIRRQLAIGNREGHGTQVVSADAHGDVDGFRLVGLVLLIRPCIVQSRQPLFLLDDGLEDIGIVVGVLALQHAHEALEAHARVDDVHGQLLQRAIGLAVILHEHKVPNLDDLRVVLVHQLTTGFAILLLLGGTRVYMNL